MCGTSLIFLIVKSLETCLNTILNYLPFDERTLLTKALMQCLRMIQIWWDQRRGILLSSLLACPPWSSTWRPPARTPGCCTEAKWDGKNRHFLKAVKIQSVSLFSLKLNHTSKEPKIGKSLRGLFCNCLSYNNPRLFPRPFIVITNKPIFHFLSSAITVP